MVDVCACVTASSGAEATRRSEQANRALLDVVKLAMQLRKMEISNHFILEEFTRKFNLPNLRSPIY